MGSKAIWISPSKRLANKINAPAPPAWRSLRVPHAAGSNLPLAITQGTNLPDFTPILASAVTVSSTWASQAPSTGLGMGGEGSEL